MKSLKRLATALNIATCDWLSSFLRLPIDLPHWVLTMPRLLCFFSFLCLVACVLASLLLRTLLASSLPFRVLGPKQYPLRSVAFLFLFLFLFSAWLPAQSPSLLNSQSSVFASRSHRPHALATPHLCKISLPNLSLLYRFVPCPSRHGK